MAPTPLRVEPSSEVAPRHRRGTSSQPAAKRGAATDREPRSEARISSRSSFELPTRKLIIGLALFSAVSSIAGSIELVVWRTGNRYLPLALLEHTPFASFLVPGLLLGVAVGVPSLLCATLAWRRSRAAVDVTLLAGGALTVWIVAELAMMRGLHVLHGIYGGLGLLLLSLGVRAAWRSPLPRHRWMVLVTLAETAGFLVPACAGAVTASAGVSDRWQAAAVIASGLVEGLALGAGQAWAFPLPVRRTRYALLTALGAGIVWSTVMLLMSMAKTESLPAAGVILGGIVTAIVGLTAVGACQLLELRRHSRNARRWIAWTALAWAVALPASFAPGPFVDESTPLWSTVVLWGCGGLVMAYVMTLITWQGARRLSEQVGLENRSR